MRGHHASVGLALFQPDIAPNAGAMLRLAACLGIAVDIIEPTGFVLTDARLRRAGMDYLDRVELRRHVSWEAFQAARSGRVVLLTTRGATLLQRAAFEPSDVLMVGSETAGVPQFVHDAAALRVRIPMRQGMRSLNVALAAAMVLGAALGQTGLWPEEDA
ncbi:MAG TPA: tRNA (cytidine(34)-2'-O)-methyltransferase [Stellaceae bacterium]|nr:tRNA (cytidine(34)-2'-O)-methyltransferase [Stellaceae bacterium]